MCLSLLTVASIKLNAQKSDFNHIDFKKADSIASAVKTKDLYNLPELVISLTSSLETDVERFRAIYMWVCSNISNDYGMYRKNMRKRRRFRDDSLRLQAWNDEFKQEVFKKLIRRKRTICTGYAYLVNILSNMADLNCQMIHGFGRTSTTEIEGFNAPNHSWNAIELNGKWYLCDPTWASGMINPETMRFEFLYNDGHFLTSPELFAVNHFPLETEWTLLGQSNPTFEKFMNAPILYGEAYKLFNSIMLPQKMHNEIIRNETVIFKYELKEDIKNREISLMVDNGNDLKKVEPASIEIIGLKLSLKHQFLKNGFYDVHLMVGKDYVCTYTFQVNSTN